MYKKMEVKKIEETPFHLVKKEEGNVIITIGKWQIAKEEFSNFEDAETWVNSKPWELIANLAYFVTNNSEIQKNQLKEE